MISKSLQRFILLGSALFLGLFLFYPLANALLSAFSRTGGDPTALFRLLLGSSAFYERLFNSINLALLATLFSVLFSVPLALALTRYTIPGRTFFQTALLVPMIVPPFVGAIGIRKIFSRFGPVNLALMKFGVITTPIDWLGDGGLVGIALVQALHLYPILFLNLSAALSRIDPSLEEAAASLGAHRWARFWRITTPILTPSIIAGGILVFTWSLTDLGTPIVFDYRPLLAVKVFETSSEIGTNPMGYTLVITLTALCLALFLASRLIAKDSDLTAGAKGTRVATTQALSPFRKWGATTLLSFFLLCAALPHIGILLVSIAPNWFMTIFPTSFNFDAYLMLPFHPLTTSSVKNSVVLSLSSTGLDLVFGLLIAWLVARGSIRGKQLLNVLTMTPLAIPGIVLAFGCLGAFSGTILDARVNPLPLLVCGYAVRRLPFMVRAVESGFRQCSVALEEAAASFGASPLTILRRIVAPILAPHLIAGSILCFCFAMLEVSESLILAAEERYYPISKAMYALLARPDGPVIASALGVATMLGITASLMLARRILGGSIGELLSR